MKSTRTNDKLEFANLGGRRASSESGHGEVRRAAADVAEPGRNWHQPYFTVEGR
jgi:hypothetical protein